MSKTVCDTNPTFMLGKRDGNGLVLGVPLVYSGLMADHTLHTSDGSSHPSQLVVSDYKTGAPSSLITGENAPFISQTPNILISTGANGNSKAGMNLRLNQERVRLLKSKYPSIRNSSRLNRFFIQSFSKSGTAPSVAQYAKIMKAIQSKRIGKNFQGSPLEYKRILDYFQFTLVEKLNSGNNLFLYRPTVHKIHDNLRSFSNYKEAIMKSYSSQNENDFVLYDKAFFATKDRPAALASVVRGIKTVFKRSSKVEGGWRVYAFTGDVRSNLINIKKQIIRDLAEKKINPNDFITFDYRTSKGNIFYFLDYEKFLKLKNTALKAMVLFYWMFNYPGDTNGLVLQKFISIMDTFHDFTGDRATGSKPAQGGFTNIWPSGSNAQIRAQKLNFGKLTANTILGGNSAFLVQVLGRNIYRLSKDNGASAIVAGKNKRNLGIQNTGKNAIRKLSHLLYFFANVMGGTKDLIGKCEEYASSLLTKTGRIVEKNQFCGLLNEGGKHALVIDIFSTGGLRCVKERSAIHGVGVMDPAPRGANKWKNLFENAGTKCVGRGTKGFPATFDFDTAGENRNLRIYKEWQRQLNEIGKMNGNITKTGASNLPGAKRKLSNNNRNNRASNVVRQPPRKAIRPLMTAARGAARTRNKNNT